MKSLTYFEIFPAIPGGLSGDAFQFDNWNGIEIMLNGVDVFVTPSISSYLITHELASIKKEWPTKTEAQYYRLCKQSPPEVLHEINIARSLYVADLYLGSQSIICTKSVAEGLRKINPKIRPQKCVPLGFKCDAKTDPWERQNQSSVGRWQETELHWQAAKQQTLDLSQNINAQDMFGLTPLHEAVGAGNLAAVESLLEAGANFLIASKHGKDALDICISLDRKEILSCFLDQGLIEISNLLAVKLFDNKAQSCIRWLISKIEDINYRETDDEPTFLMRAIRWQDYCLAESLLQKGADPTANQSGVHQTSVLGDAIKTWDTKLVELVLRYGADPNQSITENGECHPVIEALYSDCDTKIIELLISYNAELSAMLPGNVTIKEKAMQMLGTRISDIRKAKCRLILED